jgi:deoxynucleoside triphosphate triphosphohydrolase SAMHD1
MSIINDKYVLDWMPLNESLNGYYKDIDLFLSELLVEHDMTAIEFAQPKIISDPLLGYIHFNECEVYIIDSPVFQRLRYIRQLGLSYLVFPSLGYSRFEHSLGVVGRISQMINMIKINNQAVGREKSVSIDAELECYEVSLRLAGLLHDIGHCIFSHCSERVINELSGNKKVPSSELIRDIFASHFSSPKKIPFAEIFTISIIGSKRFFNYIDKRDFYSGRKLKDYLKWSVSLMLGLPIENKASTVFMGQMLSSGLDADKVDYMTREQLYSGIKLEIDLDRILNKLRVFSIKPYMLPNQLVFLNNKIEPDADVKVLGFANGGQFSFEEFCVARLALHVKVYLHQKVRAAESQIESYLKSLSKIDGFDNPVRWLSLSEDIINNPQILDYCQGQIDLFKVSSSSLYKSFQKIRDRDVYIRAFSFGPINSCSDVFDEICLDMRKDAVVPDDYFEIFNCDEILGEIEKEVVEIFRCMNITYDVDVLKEVLIDLPRLISIQQGQESLYFDFSGLSPIKWTIPIDKIMAYYQENRALAYIYSSRKNAYIIALAAEKVIFLKYGKVYNQESFISNGAYQKYKQYKEVLAEKGYYDMYPQIKGISSRLLSAASQEKIKSVYERLSVFKSINSGDRITINRITTFINQFPVDLQECALEFIGNLEVYDESILVRQVEKLFEEIDLSKKITACSLGGIGDSGSRLAYSLRGVFDNNKIVLSNVLDEGVILGSDCIIIFDDNINTGKQLYNIFGELLNEKQNIECDDHLEERHVNQIANPDAIKKIKNMQIYFVYMLGRAGIEEEVADKMGKYFGFDRKKIKISVNKLIVWDERIFSGKNSSFNHQDKRELRLFLEEISSQLMKNDDVPPEKIKKRLLGYAYTESMVLFPYNVPTMTITPLWYKGKLDNGMTWLPLAERRRRTILGKYYDEE